MGNANPNTPLAKGEGYRVVSLPPNSVWQHRLEPYFDFIIEATPKAASKSPTDILDKLAPQNGKTQPKPLLQLLREHVGQPVSLKVVSTKYRTVRSEEINELGEADIAELTLRKERYDEAFDSYFPVTAIQPNSPIGKSGVREGQYLIGCREFAYASIDAFMEGLYERYFDKEIPDKTVQLALYDIASDALLLKSVQLRRGWGGKGLLGCDFLQGLLNKFPTQLEQQRKEVILKENNRQQIHNLRIELGECDGSSKALVEALKTQPSRKQRQLRDLRKLLSREAPLLPVQPQPVLNNSRQPEQRMGEPAHGSIDGHRLSQLQEKVNNLEGILHQVKAFLRTVEVDEQ